MPHHMGPLTVTVGGPTAVYGPKLGPRWRKSNMWAVARQLIWANIC